MTDYYLDAATGSDSNDGLSAAQAWQTVARAHTWFTALPDGSFGPHKLIVAEGTYPGNFYFRAGNKPNMAGTLTIEFMGPSVIQYDGSDPNGIGAAGFNGANTLEVIAYGNQTLIDWDTASSANGISTSGNSSCTAYDFYVQGADDGASSHGTSTLNIHRCVISRSKKYGIAPVSTSVLNVYDSVVVGGSDPATSGVVFAGTSSRCEWERTIFQHSDAGGASDSMSISKVDAKDCIFGSISQRFRVLIMTDCTIENSFVHFDGDLLRFAGTTLTRCYGQFSMRHRGSAADLPLTVQGCVFTGPANGAASNNWIYYPQPLGDGTPVIAENTLFSGYDKVIDNLGASETTSWNSNSALTNCAFWNIGAAAYPAGIGATVTAPFTADPEVPNGTGQDIDGYRAIASSALLTAGTGGGEIGINQGQGYTPTIENY